MSLEAFRSDQQIEEFGKADARAHIHSGTLFGKQADSAIDGGRASIEKYLSGFKNMATLRLKILRHTATRLRPPAFA